MQKHFLLSPKLLSRDLTRLDNILSLKSDYSNHNTINFFTTLVKLFHPFHTRIMNTMHYENCIIVTSMVIACCKRWCLWEVWKLWNWMRITIRNHVPIHEATKFKICLCFNWNWSYSDQKLYFENIKSKCFTSL